MTLPVRVWNKFCENLGDFFGLGDGSVTYYFPRWLFLRLLGLVILVAFAGWFEQGRALVGPDGLEPIRPFLLETAAKFGSFAAFIRVPSVFWISAGAGAIVSVTVAGMVAGLALVLNVFPRAALVTSWVLYVSLISTCGDFAPAQLDGLILEAMFLSIFFAPRGFRPGLGERSPPHMFAIFSMRWFVFRVMFQSGLIKLLGPDDNSWFSLSVLDYMYESAPFPTVLGYFDHNFPHWWHVGEVLFTLVAEVAAPLLALLGRGPRLVALVIWARQVP